MAGHDRRDDHDPHQDEHSETVDLELRFANGEVTSHSRASLHLWATDDARGATSLERVVVLATPVAPHLHDQVAKLVLSTGERWQAVSRDGRSWIEAPPPS